MAQAIGRALGLVGPGTQAPPAPVAPPTGIRLGEALRASGRDVQIRAQLAGDGGWDDDFWKEELVFKFPDGDIDPMELCNACTFILHKLGRDAGTSFDRMDLIISLYAVLNYLTPKETEIEWTKWHIQTNAKRSLVQLDELKAEVKSRSNLLLGLHLTNDVEGISYEGKIPAFKWESAGVFSSELRGPMGTTPGDFLGNYAVIFLALYRAVAKAPEHLLRIDYASLRQTWAIPYLHVDFKPALSKAKSWKAVVGKFSANIIYFIGGPYISLMENQREPEAAGCLSQCLMLRLSYAGTPILRHLHAAQAKVGLKHLCGLLKGDIFESQFENAIQGWYAYVIDRDQQLKVDQVLGYEIIKPQVQVRWAPYARLIRPMSLMDYSNKVAPRLTLFLTVFTESEEGRLNNTIGGLKLTGELGDFRKAVTNSIVLYARAKSSGDDEKLKAIQENPEASGPFGQFVVGLGDLGQVQQAVKPPEPIQIANAGGATAGTQSQSVNLLLDLDDIV